MAETLIPRAAATILPLRDAPDGYEILMLRRNVRSEFMGGAFVFPGGAVDAADAEGASLVFGRSDDVASTRLSLASGGLSYYVAALRELFEEGGLLITCDENGEPSRFNAECRDRLADARHALNNREGSFFEMLRDEGLLLDLRGIEYFAHWITPPGRPRRFDTRFFITRAPNDQIAMHDEGETVDSQWLRPVDAFGAHERGEIELPIPTRANLNLIAHFETVDDVLNFARSQATIVTVAPQGLPNP